MQMHWASSIAPPGFCPYFCTQFEVAAVVSAARGTYILLPDNYLLAIRVLLAL